MRPNYAMDAPPTHIEVGGHPYPVNTDFRVWIEVMDLMNQISNNPDTPKKQERTGRAIEQIEILVFGGLLDDENILDVLKGVSEFLRGYPSAPVSGSGNHEKTYSFQYDLNEIIIAIRNQHGVDLSYRNTDGCHWWEFLLYFHTLCGDHFILNLMNARGYNGKDKEMRKRKQAFALPVEVTADEQDEMDAFNALFD